MKKVTPYHPPAMAKHTELKNEELKLFHSYNRHATSESKLAILTKLIEVIHKQEILKQL